LAIRLELAGASTARFWINLQANYDLWVAMQHEQPPVQSLQEAAHAH
jgi:plasmid maintenance system antidote protein VapI